MVRATNPAGLGAPTMTMPNDDPSRGIAGIEVKGGRGAAVATPPAAMSAHRTAMNAIVRRRSAPSKAGRRAVTGSKAEGRAHVVEAGRATREPHGGAHGAHGERVARARAVGDLDAIARAHEVHCVIAH